MAFEKGKSGNPGGRSTEKLWRDAIRKALARKADGDLQGIDVVADKLVAAAVGSDIAAIKEIGDRIDGKPKQQTELSGPDGEAIPLGIRVSFPAKPAS